MICVQKLTYVKRVTFLSLPCKNKTFFLLLQKIDRVLDDLRKFLGDEDVIAERCHKLIALGEFEVETSVLDCNPYCDGKTRSSGRRTH